MLCAAHTDSRKAACTRDRVVRDLVNLFLFLFWGFGCTELDLNQNGPGVSAGCRINRQLYLLWRQVCKLIFSYS